MKNNNHSNTKFILSILILLSIWIILFEFVLPPNSFLPKPSIVYQSFSALWFNYDLMSNLISSLGSLYLAMILSVMISKYIWRRTIFGKIPLTFAKNSNRIYIYLFSFAFLMLSLIWFSDFYFFKFILIIILSTIVLLVKWEVLSNEVHKGFIDSMQTLGFTDGVIREKIISKISQPAINKYLKDFQFTLWLILINYEILSNREGIGFMFRQIVEFRDLSAAIALCIILIFLFTLLNRVYFIVIKRLE